MALGPQPVPRTVGFPVWLGRLLRTLAAMPRGWLLATRAALGQQPWTADDIGLVGRAASGDHDAFEALIAPRAARLMSTARKILRDPDSADDAVQRTLVAAWRTLPRLRDHARFDAWLSKLLVNECWGSAATGPCNAGASPALVDRAHDRRRERCARDPRSPRGGFPGPDAGAPRGRGPSALRRPTACGGRRDLRHPSGNRTFASALRARLASRGPRGGRPPR